MNELNWTEEQSNTIKEAIAAEIENARLAHKIIPEFKLTSTDRAVAGDRYDYALGTINETHQNVGEYDRAFFITKLQAEDEDLTRARARVRRAAQELARNHDEVVFRTSLRDEIDANAGTPGFHAVVPITPPNCDGLVPAAARAVAVLDAQGFRTSFVMVAGHDVYTQLYTRPVGAADVPVKAVQGLLEDGPIHRSAVLPTDEALILSISGEEIDRAVAVVPTLEFLRIGAAENRELRLLERFLTRFKQTYSAVLLRFV